MIIHQCDKCGKRETQKRGQQASTPPGWYPLCFGGYSYSSPRWYYEICITCREQMGIPEIDPEQTVGDSLIQLITEIASETVQAGRE